MYKTFKIFFYCGSPKRWEFDLEVTGNFIHGVGKFVYYISIEKLTKLF